ncbi:MAG TPA: hypothetical protein VIM07_06020 [Chitinophagaceae bacterium]
MLIVLLCMMLFGEIRAQQSARSANVSPSPKKIATLDQVLAAKQDLWGLAAMQQPNGASFEFFANLLPPLRYVNAKFHYYPIVLCAPGSKKEKARLVSNGSAINARAELSTWHEIGTPVLFFVGAEQAPFGEKISALNGPHYERGYLPVVQIDYHSGKATYREETFASIDWADHSILFTRFNLKEGKSGTITTRIESMLPLRVIGNTICDSLGRMIVSFDQAWRWNAEQKTLTAQLSASGKAALAIATEPLPSSTSANVVSASDYDVQKKKCVAKWEAILAGAMRVEVPEPVVNAAWKSTIVGSFQLLQGNNMNYSSGNLYEVMFEAESADAVRALLLWGLKADSRKMIPPLLDYGNNEGLTFHDAAFKLQLLAQYYWLTRDKTFIQEQKPRWSRCLEILTSKRDQATGLLPREAYCGDEKEQVFSLNSNTNAWRGLHDMAAVLRQIDEHEEAARISKIAETLRQAVLAAVDKSERQDVQPPFMPIALFGEEKPYDMLTSTRRGSYWNLIIPYVIGSGIFSGTEHEASMLRYLEEHGGICMGMIRFHQHSHLFANEDGLDDLFGLRYVDALLRRDEPERAIVSFYGKLAQGMTRDTYLNAEGTGLRPLDEFGRPMYMPPTCGGALFLCQLRSMLVQDYDLDNNGEPETLRLLFATPRRWLENGKIISVERAPTSFGEVSVRVESKLALGEVIANVSVPEKNTAKRTLLRIRLPQNWKINSAQVGLRKLKVDAAGTVDISTLAGKNSIRFKVSRI